MPTEILMPALSPTMEEGKLARWLVAEGVRVRAGDVIAEIETDKASMEIEAAEDGVVARLLVAAGTAGVKVNTPIAMLAVEDEPPAPSPSDPSSRGEGRGEGRPHDASSATSAFHSATSQNSSPVAAHVEHRAAPHPGPLPVKDGERGRRV